MAGHGLLNRAAYNCRLGVVYANMAKLGEELALQDTIAILQQMSTQKVTYDYETFSFAIPLSYYRKSLAKSLFLEASKKGLADAKLANHMVIREDYTEAINLVASLTKLKHVNEQTFAILLAKWLQEKDKLRILNLYIFILLTTSSECKTTTRQFA
jgi:hypothetical protein